MTQKCCLTQINFDFFFPPKVLVFSEKLKLNFEICVVNIFRLTYWLLCSYISGLLFKTGKKNFRVFDLGFITKMLPGL